MIAKERAARFSWQACPGGEGHDAGEDGHAHACAKCNAEVIRAAEDDALERAAQRFEADAMVCEFEECDTYAGLMNAAHIARSLKSGGAK